MQRFVLFLAVALAAVVSPAYAAQITLVNHGFENGFDGWRIYGNSDATVVGPTSVVTYNDIFWDVTPAGSFMAALNSNPEPVSADELDAFFGLPGQTLQSMNIGDAGGDLTDGAAISQDFFGNAGDTVTMFFDYIARDYIPFNDPAFGVLVGPSGFQAQTLASVYGDGIAVGTAGNSGWRQVTFTLQETGQHTIGFGVTNDKDTILDAALLLDNAAGGSTTEDPGDLNEGESPLFPVLPDGNPLPNLFVFNDPIPNLWYDPPFAESYTYTLFGGGLFTQFSTPDAGFGFGPLTFTDLNNINASFVAAAGTLYDLTPTSQFMLSGLPPGAIDFESPSFMTAFPAFLNWTGTVSTLEIEVTPFDSVSEVPEPATYAMMSFGLGALYIIRRRRQQR